MRKLRVAGSGLLESLRRRRLGFGGRTDLRIEVGVTATHPSLVKLGQQVRLLERVRLRGNVSLGDHTDIRPYTLLDAKEGSIEIGDHCSVNDYCVLYGMGGLVIGNNVRIATHTVIVTANHIFDDPDTPIRLQGIDFKPVKIGDDVWIGAHACIMGGVEIGSGSVIGAGAVVTRSIPPMSIAVGNPAKVIRKRGSLKEIPEEAGLLAVASGRSRE